MLAGFQAQGSLGRILVDGASRVRIQGEEIEVNARIRQLDLYSGHADATELATWVNERMPIGRTVFLTHGEEAGLNALRKRLSTLIGEERIIAPQLDEAFELGSDGAHRIETEKIRRLPPEKVARLDWHNNLSKLLLDVSETVGKAADERGRSAIIRRLRRALDEPET